MIGAGDRLPWRLPDDLRHFRALTIGPRGRDGAHAPGSRSAGRCPTDRTWWCPGIPRFDAPGAEVARSLDDALARVRLPPPAFCIGGAELYALALPRADVLHLTEIGRGFDGDVSFPAFDRARGAR